MRKNTANRIAKLAGVLDKKGLLKEADLLDKCLTKLATCEECTNGPCPNTHVSCPGCSGDVHQSDIKDGKCPGCPEEAIVQESSR